LLLRLTLLFAFGRETDSCFAADRRRLWAFFGVGGFCSGISAVLEVPKTLAAVAATAPAIAPTERATEANATAPGRLASAVSRCFFVFSRGIRFNTRPHAANARGLYRLACPLHGLVGLLEIGVLFSS